jgi:hypothetical protein
MYVKAATLYDFALSFFISDPTYCGAGGWLVDVTCCKPKDIGFAS